MTTVELMPVQSFVSEQFLVEKGLSNYWGYNPLGWFALVAAVVVLVGLRRQASRAWFTEP